jgi:hypothetical protein
VALVSPVGWQARPPSRHFSLNFHRKGIGSKGGADVAGRMAGEPTFPILYQVQAALGKSNLFLPPRMLTKNAFFTPLQVSNLDPSLNSSLFIALSVAFASEKRLPKGQYHEDPQRDNITEKTNGGLHHS